MALGEVSATAKRDEHYTGDMATLADGVLEAVRADWLKRVPVEEAASFFGGSSQSRGEGSPTSDYVMLRAVSLVLLKSMEFEMQSADRKGTELSFSAGRGGRWIPAFSSHFHYCISHIDCIILKKNGCLPVKVTCRVI